MTSRHLLAPILAALILMPGYDASAHAGWPPTANARTPRTVIKIDLPFVNGTAADNRLRMRQYWQAELGLTRTYDRKVLLWRLAGASVVPGRIRFSDPRSVEIGGGSAWGAGVVIWYHPVTVVARDGSKSSWLLVTVQEKPGQSEQMVDLLPQGQASRMRSRLPPAVSDPAVKLVEDYFRLLEKHDATQAAALLAPQSGMVPDQALQAATRVKFHGGTLDRVGRAAFYEFAFSAEVQYQSDPARQSGLNDYFFTVSNLNGPWQILAEGSGP